MTLSKSRAFCHLPQRTCISCGAVESKNRLIRFVRVASGVVEVDPSGRKMGRGAYLCNAPRCWETERKRNRLEKALRTNISHEERDDLLRAGGQFCRASLSGGAGGSQ